jgi:hypothetical protein
MAAIDATGFQRLKDMAGMLVGTLDTDRSAFRRIFRNCGNSVSNQLRVSVEWRR